MNGHPKRATERLYLHKDGDDEIYVDSVLHQHHIDGIRFLYTQFKKKNPGVIINNPLGYGNAVQVALFLKAIQHLLTKPILILCKEGEETGWLNHFRKLTQDHEIVIAAESPFMKKPIFINTMLNLEQFCRRDWSVIAVDNDAFLKEKTLQNKFRADFKIWITPVDMKDNLQMFASIFKWLFPKDKLNIDDYKAKPGDIKGNIAKAVLLDAFQHDIVFRTHLLTPFEIPDVKIEDTPKKVTKKNKDATGTKIKRSKRLLEGAGTSKGLQENSDNEVGASAVKIPRMDTPEPDAGDFSIGNFRNNFETSKCDVIDKSEMDVESFIRNEKPISRDQFNFMQNYDNISHNDDVGKTDLAAEEPSMFTPEKLSPNAADAAMDKVDNQESFIDSDTNSESLMIKPKTYEESSQDTNAREAVEQKQMSPDLFSDNINSGNNGNIMSETHNLESNDTKPEVQVKVEDTDKIAVESPKKDLNSKIMEMDEQIFKKFQGSLLDRLF